LGDRNKVVLFTHSILLISSLPSLQKSLALLAVAAVAAIDLRDIGVNSGNQGAILFTGLWRWVP